MQREAWIGLAASLVLHGVLAALLLVSFDQGPGAEVTPAGSAGERRTRVRLVPRGGGAGGEEAAADRGDPRTVPRPPSTTRPAPSVPGTRSTAPEGPPAPSEAPVVAEVPPAPGDDGAAVGPARSGTTTGGEAAAGEGTPAGGIAGATGATGEATAGGTGAGSGTGSAAAGDADRRSRAVGALSERLRTAARSCYPPAAKRLRLRGDVAVRFCLDGSGELASLEVERSSGAPLLDRAALECVVPRALPVRDAGGCFSLPVRFGD